MRYGRKTVPGTNQNYLQATREDGVAVLDLSFDIIVTKTKRYAARGTCSVLKKTATHEDEQLEVLDLWSSNAKYIEQKNEVKYEEERAMLGL